MNRSYLSVLEALLSQPTAPFQEERIVAVVEAWARAHGLPVEKDASGNVLLRHRGKGDAPASRSKWVFAAHMDHPGFTSIECSGRNLLAEFRGHVGPSYFVGSPRAILRARRPGRWSDPRRRVGARHALAPLQN